MLERVVRYRAAALVVVACALLLRTDLTVRSQAATSLDDWPMFLHDVARSSFNSQETRLSPSNAPNLRLKWKFEATGVLVAQPIVAGDTVYIGDWDGKLYAVAREWGRL